VAVAVDLQVFAINSLQRCKLLLRNRVALLLCLSLGLALATHANPCTRHGARVVALKYGFDSLLLHSTLDLAARLFKPTGDAEQLIADIVSFEAHNERPIYSPKLHSTMWGWPNYK
jgi:hypothetical protein